MAWTAPRSWSTGETVTSTMFNEQIRDNLLHVAGSCGFDATVSTLYGIEPAAGYFAGGNLQNYHVESGQISLTGGVYTTQSFGRAFAAAPSVVYRPSTTYDWANCYITSIGTTKFTMYAAGGLSIYWLAWGSDT